MRYPWKTHWALALVKGIREPHEVKKKPINLTITSHSDCLLTQTLSIYCICISKQLSIYAREPLSIQGSRVFLTVPNMPNYKQINRTMQSRSALLIHHSFFHDPQIAACFVTWGSKQGWGCAESWALRFSALRMVLDWNNLKLRLKNAAPSLRPRPHFQNLGHNVSQYGPTLNRTIRPLRLRLKQYRMITYVFVPIIMGIVLR